jgi:hypothetical protein
MTTPRLVLVEWEDASATDESTWLARESAPDMPPVIFQQVGWLIEQTDAHLILTCALSDKLMAARDRIPAGMVRKIVPLNLGRKGK